MTTIDGNLIDLAVAADLGGTNLRTALIDRNGQIHHRLKHSTPHRADPQEIAGDLVTAVRECETAAAGIGRIVGVTAAIPGTVHVTEGTVMNAPNLPWLNGFALTAALQADLGMPIAIENDANAAAVGEHWLGAARGSGAMLMVTLGTGVGGGVILDGKLWRGIDGTAGEIGHVGVELNGPKCGCGSCGCVEQFASATAIVRQAHELLAQYPDSATAKLTPLTAAEVYRCGVEGDPLAIEVFRRAGTYLGMALASLINVLNPEVIVIGGGVAAGWDLFIDPLREQVKLRTFPEPGRRAQVVRAAYGDDAGLLGAAYLAFQSS
jgi:glucokinase